MYRPPKRKFRARVSLIDLLGWAYILFLLALVGGSIYVALHFIIKYW